MSEDKASAKRTRTETENGESLASKKNRIAMKLEDERPPEEVKRLARFSSNLTLQCGTWTFECDKNTLCLTSEYFRNAIDALEKDTTQSSILELPCPISRRPASKSPQAVWNYLLAVYQEVDKEHPEKIVIEQHLADLADLSDYFHNPTLLARCDNLALVKSAATTFKKVGCPFFLILHILTFWFGLVWIWIFFFFFVFDSVALGGTGLFRKGANGTAHWFHFLLPFPLPKTKIALRKTLITAALDVGEPKEWACWSTDDGKTSENLLAEMDQKELSSFATELCLNAAKLVRPMKDRLARIDAKIAAKSARR